MSLIERVRCLTFGLPETILQMSCSSLERGARGVIVAALLCGCGQTSEAGPLRVTLNAEFGSQSKAVRLSDGARVAMGGDIALFTAVQLSLVPTGEKEIPLFCEKGTFAALADVPIGVEDCAWEGRLFLGGAFVHEMKDSSVIGLSALVRSLEDDTLYRLRILGDSARQEGDNLFGSAVFEYEPVP